MKKVLVVLASVWVGACGGGEPTAPATVAPPRLTATLATAEKLEAGARLAVQGTLTAEKVTAVSSRVMALVTAVHVDLGDTVRAGQVLVSIDATAAEGQVAQARGALAQAEAAQVLAARNRERFEALAREGAASELELDTARMQAAQAAGAVEQAKGAVAAASSVARESRVVAPFAGRVAARRVEVGDLAAPGRPLVELESLVGRRVVIQVPERLAAAAILGAELPIRLDGFPALGELTGRVVERSPGPDPMTHSYTVKLELPAAALGEAALPTGGAARAFLPAPARTVVVVPTAALVEQGGLTLVVVQGADGRAETRVVTLGERLPDDRVEVLSGLAGGERVAIGLGSAPAAGTVLEEGVS